MQSDNPLVVNPLLRRSWDWAEGPSLGLRVESLLDLAKDRAQLPSPVFFEVPEGSADEQHWRTLIVVSEQYCGCPRRRILWPQHGRSRLLTRVPDGKNLVSVAYDKARNARNPLGRSPVYLAPHGGDIASSFVMVALGDHGIVVCQRPFMAAIAGDNVRHIWTPTRHAIDFVGLHSVHGWDMPLTTARGVLRRDGEIVFMHAIPDPFRDGATVGVPIFSVVSIDFGLSNGAPSIVLEVDGGVRVFSDLTLEDAQQHVCMP